MYKVRSSWVHHAKEKEFKIHDLTELQKIVHELLVSLIGKTKGRSTKQELRDEIDEAIIAAY